MSGEDTVTPDICFAWEDTTRNKMASNDLNLHGVHTIVVIGYSFPDFNREIDEYIWASLSDTSKSYILAISRRRS